MLNTWDVLYLSLLKIILWRTSWSLSLYRHLKIMSRNRVVRQEWMRSEWVLCAENRGERLSWLWQALCWERRGETCESEHWPWFCRRESLLCAGWRGEVRRGWGCWLVRCLQQRASELPTAWCRAYERWPNVTYPEPTTSFGDEHGVWGGGGE